MQSDVDTESLLQPSDATVATSRPVYNEDAVDDESSPQSGQWPSRPSTSFAQTCMKFLKETYQGTFNSLQANKMKKMLIQSSFSTDLFNFRVMVHSVSLVLALLPNNIGS